MKIRKLFKYEMAHLVRNAWSERCSKSIHGHSYLVEFVFKSDILDNAGMVSDFGFLRKWIYPFVDSFDHATVLWNRPEDKHIVDFFKANFDRVIITEFSSTAELQAKMFYDFAAQTLEYITANNLWENKEVGVVVDSVRVHETTTGWAEYTELDYNNDPIYNAVKDTQFSAPIIKDWPEEFTVMYTYLSTL